MANRNKAPSYCNTCQRFDINKAMSNGGRAMCSGYEREHAWDDPATVLYVSVTDSERGRRKQLVIQLHNEKKEREKEIADAKD